MMDRVVRMMDRDKNFPCICIWSLGNESGYGPAHLAMAGYVRAKDPSRPVHYEGGGSRTAATDICCPMYARVHQIKVCPLDQIACIACSTGTSSPLYMCSCMPQLCACASCGSPPSCTLITIQLADSSLAVPGEPGCGHLSPWYAFKPRICHVGKHGSHVYLLHSRGCCPRSFKVCACDVSMP